MTRIGQLFDQRTASMVLLAFGIVVGLLFPSVSQACEPFALHALFLVIVLSLVAFGRTPASELMAMDRSSIRLVAWQQLVAPAIVISAAILLRFSDTMIILVAVTVCSGSLFASPTLAQLLELDRRRALQSMMLSTLVMPVSLFFFLYLLRGDGVSLNLAAYSWRTAIFLVLPLLVFMVYRMGTRSLSAATNERIEHGARWGTILALLVFGIGMMYPVYEQLRDHPQTALLYLLLATLLSVVLFALTAIVMHRHGAVESLTCSVLGAFRNVGLGFALVGDMVSSGLDVYVGVSMLPVFIGPFILQVAFAQMLKRALPAPT